MDIARCGLRRGVHDSCRLHDAVVAKIGKDAVQDEVNPHGNFYLSKDGWHFVFNEYEVACYAVGDVEVVIPR